MKALFDGLVRLDINELQDAEKMMSKEGEVVAFNKTVKQ